MLVFSANAEVKLVEMLSNIESHAMAWRMVHFHFSELLEHYKSAYQTKIAVNMIKDFVRDSEGGIFVCEDKDIIILCKGMTHNQIEKLIFRLRYMFSDDPLSYTTDGQENPQFCTMHDMTVAWGYVFDLAKQKLMQSRRTGPRLLQRSQQDKTPDKAHNPAEIIDDTIRPMTPQRLVNIENDIQSADLSRVMRRQPICAISVGKDPRRLFDEYYINIAHLRKLIMGNVDFLSNRWLFKYLTQILDMKMLEMLRSRPNDYFDVPVSLNLNVDTLLSERFMAFDSVIKPATRVSIVIEIQLSDVFTDMNAFQLARETVQKLGYRVCLDGVTDTGFLQINREGLGFDLVKLLWNADLASDVREEHNRKIKDAVKRCGPNRVILSRCDNADAVAYGHALGITLFQGRHIDALLDPHSRVVN